MGTSDSDLSKQRTYAAAVMRKGKGQAQRTALLAAALSRRKITASRPELAQGLCFRCGSDSLSGAAAAIIYSIMETAKERGLKPLEYFQHLLEELPQIDRNDKEKLKRYLPYSDALPAYCKAPNQKTNN